MSVVSNGTPCLPVGCTLRGFISLPFRDEISNDQISLAVWFMKACIHLLRRRLPSAIQRRRGEAWYGAGFEVQTGSLLRIVQTILESLIFLLNHTEKFSIERNTGSSRLIWISLLRFSKTITKIWLMRFYGLFILLLRT